MRIHNVTTALVSLALAATGLTVSDAYAAAATTQNLGACITSPTRLHENQAIESGGYRLVMQNDGNLVEYSSTNRALWQSGTYGHPNAWAVQQGDGNLVIHATNGSVLWASYPALAQGSYGLCIQTDANVVTYNPTGRAVWATNSITAPTGALRSINLFPQASGQCTYWAEEMAHSYIHAYPAFWGDAGTWDTYAAAQGWHVDHTPRAGSVVVFEPDTHGAGRYGHVAFVLDVYPSTGSIRVSEMDYPHAGVIDTRVVTGVFHTTDVEFIALNP